MYNRPWGQGLHRLQSTSDVLIKVQPLLTSLKPHNPRGCAAFTVNAVVARVLRRENLLPCELSATVTAGVGVAKVLIRSFEPDVTAPAPTQPWLCPSILRGHPTSDVAVNHPSTLSVVVEAQLIVDLWRMIIFTDPA